MDAPKISVIIPVYNSEKYLERCINSILSQTFKKFECLLIDDCSTDNSLEICNRFKESDSRIKVYHNRCNEGTALTKKIGVFQAAAEYIIFVDNDDWIEPVMLEELYAKMKCGDFDMVCCDFYNEYRYKTVLNGGQDTENKSNIELMKEIITWNNFLPVTWNKLVKAEIYKKVNFPKVVYSEDRAIMIQILYFCHKIGYVNKGLYHWSHIPTSASRTSKRQIKNFIEDYISYTSILLFVIDNRINTDEFIKAITNHPENMGFLCSNNKKILNEYKKSINKIIEMKMDDTLTQEALLVEQNNVEKRIIRLDKVNYLKIINRAINWVKKKIPKTIKMKIKNWLKHGYGT